MLRPRQKRKQREWPPWEPKLEFSPAWTVFSKQLGKSSGIYADEIEIRDNQEEILAIKKLNEGKIPLGVLTGGSAAVHNEWQKFHSARI